MAIFTFPARVTVVFSIFILAIILVSCSVHKEKKIIQVASSTADSFFPGYVKQVSFQVEGISEEWKLKWLSSLQEWIKDRYPTIDCSKFQSHEADIYFLFRMGNIEIQETCQHYPEIFFEDNLASRPIFHRKEQKLLHIKFPICLELLDSYLGEILWKKEAILYAVVESISQIHEEGYRAFHRWIRQSFSWNQKPSKIEIYPFMSDDILQLLQKGDFQKAIYQLTGIIDILLLLGKTRKLTREEASQLAIAYHNRSAILSCIAARKASQRDQQFATLLWKLIFQQN